MSFFNANITGGSSGGVIGGLVSKFEKKVEVSSANLAEIVIDFSEDISNYDSLTSEQFIVEMVNIGAIAAGDAELTHTYDSESGKLTITSTNSSLPFASGSAVELTFYIYIAGAVQTPPTVKVTGVASVLNVRTSLSMPNISGYLPGNIDNYEFTMIPYGYLTSGGGNTSTLDVAMTVENDVLTAPPVNLRFTRSGSADSHYVNMMYKVYSKNYEILKAGATSEVDVSVPINLIDNFDIGKVILRVTKCVAATMSGSFNNVPMVPVVADGVLTIPAVRYAGREDEGLRYIFNYDILYVKGD